MITSEKRGSRSPYFYMGHVVSPALVLIGLVILNDARPDVDLHLLWADAFLTPFGTVVEVAVGCVFFLTGVAVGLDVLGVIKCYSARIGLWAVVATLFLMQFSFAVLAMVAGYGLSWGVASLSLTIFWGTVVMLLMGPPMRNRRRG